jgi:hypothetical protein
MTRRLGAPAAVAAAALLLAAPAGAAQTQSQRFFAEKLLADRGTSSAVKDLLRAGGGFVDRSVAFRDLTGDDREDAVVRVQSGGVGGAVAVYVFSTDTGEEASELTMVFAAQRLQRGRTSVRDGVLHYRTALPDPGDEPCCPARVVETRLRWDPEDHRLRVDERYEVAP